MEERLADNSVQPEAKPAPCEKRRHGGLGDWGRLTLLLILAGAIHAWVIAHTTVTSRDSIGFIRYALWLEQKPWLEALPKIQQHPLYPLTLLVVSWPVRQLAGTSAETLALSSQLASAIPGVLLVIPMYFLGRQLFDRRVGFWGALLFQCLPIFAQVTSDGLSDGVYLLMIATAMLLAGRALRNRSAWDFGWCGLAIGLAYLTRPEGLLLSGAVLLTLVLLQFAGWPRWTLRQGLGGALALVVGAGLVAAPYMAVIGAVTNKPGAVKLLTNQVPLDTLGQPDAGPAPPAAPAPRTAVSGPALALAPLAVWWMDEGRPGAPPWHWGVKVLLRETMHAFHYLAWVPALLGLWWFRGRFRSAPAAWVMLIFCGGMSLLLLRVLLGVHYLSERHTLILVMCGSLWAAAALVPLADAVPGWIERRRARPLAPRWRALLPVACLLLCTGWCLPQSLKPLHANRAGHRAAGGWLAAHARPSDRIIDPACWAHYYSGRLLDEERLAPVTAAAAPIRYVVLTNSTNRHGRLLGVPKARELADSGTLVYRWTPTAKEERRYRAEVVEVFAVPMKTPRSRPSPAAELHPIQ